MTPPNRSTTGPRRWLAAAAAAALGSALLPVSTAGAAIDTAEACPEAIPAGGFTDLAANPAADAVDCLAAYGIAQGVSETSFGPAIAINRAQVATFLVRILEGTDGFVIPDPVDDAFDDDDGYAPHEDNINIAYDLGIIDGYGDGSFGPRDLVTRAQMAKLVVNTLFAAGVDVPEDNPDAFDDDDGNVQEIYIDALAALDVVDGIEPGTYNPSGNVRRDTMALYLSRSVQVLVDGALWEPYVAPADAPAALGALLVGAADFTFGDDAGDTLTVVYDSAVTVDAASTITVDSDGAGPEEPVELVCGPALTCVADDDDATFTVVDAGVVEDVFVDEGAQVVATTGITGDGGLTPDASYPVDLFVGVIRTDEAAVTADAGSGAAFIAEFATNVAVEGASVGIAVDATCVDTDADEVGDDPGFTLEVELVDQTLLPLDLVCGEGVVLAAYPEEGIDLAPVESVFVPMVATFDTAGTYTVALTLVDAEAGLLAATSVEVEVTPAVP